jgi:hypothetical protein
MADNLSVSVTADTSELRAQLALAQADLRAFGAETKKLATEIRGGGGSGCCGASSSRWRASSTTPNPMSST